MNKLIKYALYGIGGGVLLMLLVVGYFAATFNPNDYKDEIVKLVKDKKQRTLHIEGDIKLSYWPKIGANLGKLSISEHQSDKEFASVNSVKVALAVMPLLKKELVVDTIYVDGAKANVVKNKEGKFNFDDLLSKDEEESKIKFDIDGVNVTNSEVRYTDETAGAKYNITKFNMKSGHIALAEPVDLDTNFTITSNQPETAANVNLKGNFLVDPKTKHFKVKGLDSHIVGDLLSGTGMDIVASGDVDAKPELMEFLVDDLKFVASGKFEGATQNISLSAPALSILKDEVSSKKVSVSLGQEKAGDVFKANMVLADMKGSPKALQSSGITGDLSAAQGKRTVTGTFSSPFNGNIQDLIFDIPKLAGNLDIKDPSLPNGGVKGMFNLVAHTDIKKELANSQFNLLLADTNLKGNVDVTGFKTDIHPINIKFN
jgi:AsmA family